MLPVMYSVYVSRSVIFRVLHMQMNYVPFWLIHIPLSVVCRFFSAVDARTLRAAVGTFYDLLALATRTLEAFGPAQP